MNKEPIKSDFFQKLEDVQTEPHEIEQRAIRDDAKIEAVLQELNQKSTNFLKNRDLPATKQRHIINVLHSNFVDNNLNQKSLDETQTPIKTIYKEIYEKLIPVYDVTGINDFTGK